MNAALRRTRLLAAVATLALTGSVSGAVPAGANGGDRPAVGETRIFARVPYPGQPVGLLVEGDTVWATPAALNEPEVAEWPVWAYDLRTGRERPEDTMTVRPAGPADMALGDMARDAEGRIYIVDMNGRILRTEDGRRPARGRRWELYATVPAHGNGTATAPWPAGMSMPIGITFDGAGNAYVPDVDFPGLWRVPPGGGEAELWFVDPALQGAPFGATAARVSPDGRDLYFSICQSGSPHQFGDGAIYRLPLDSPSPSRLTQVFRSPGSCPDGLAFGASGKLYASLFLANQVLVLRPDGTEERRFPTKEENSRQAVPYDQPGFLAFDGHGWLLVANQSLTTPRSPRWAILKAFVDDVAGPALRQ